MREHTIEHRVTYKETDQMRVVYYSNYLVWFEVGRTEYFRSRGLVYKDLEEKEKIFLPVVESHCVYRAPVRYDEVVRVKTRLSDIVRSRMVFEYEITRDGAITTTGYTKHVFVNGSGRPISIPETIRENLSR
ncbi:MAG: YbgC/FadM family acyl-CoA thioesterase [Candidatus Omnitrophica bacterium]|nr:YbgC/FadM family acyl-CoA thioesterase [Candidatus Omnitrophota bacterium]